MGINSTLRSFSFAVLALLLAFSGTSSFAQQTTHSFNFGGSTRQYLQYVPGIYDGNTPVPLVFALHGLGDNMNNFAGIGMNYIADTANFIVVTPEALVDNLMGSTAWNSGAGAFGIQLNQNVDDVGFISALMDTMQARFNIDTTRIYVCGFSMGGFMSHRLACQLNNRVAAIASVAGTKGTYLTCNPGRPVPVLHFHGTADGNVSYTGNPFGSDAEPTVEYWANQNNCTNGPDTTYVPDNAADGFTVEHFEWSGCDDNFGVEFFKINGADHVWLLSGYDIHYTREIWKFFSKYSMSPSVGIAEPATLPAPQTYPNPANQSLRFAFSSPVTAKMSYQIVSVDGKMMQSGAYSANAGENEINVDVRNWPAGMYLLQLSGNERYETARFVVQH